MTDISDFLAEKAKSIDERILKYLPEKFDEKYLEWAFGKARYAYDVKTLQKALSGPIWDFLKRGGKRWRPAMFLLVAEAMGGNIEKMADFVVVPELAHNGSIMVDDIEDMSEMRRGKPCTHNIYGIDVAINAGNLMYFLPFLVFIKNRDSFEKDILIRAYETFSQEMIIIHLGQAMDIWWHKGNDEGLTEERYLQMCAYKTGTLARLSAKLAAILSGGTPEQIEKIGKMAEAIGVGFQIQDDILSASGKEFMEKKGFGDDITEGKRTLIVIHAMKTLEPEDGKRLKEILNMHTRDPKLMQEALDLLKRGGSVEYAREFAKKMVREAWEEANPIIPDSPAKEKLKSFVDYLITRKI